MKTIQTLAALLLFAVRLFSQQNAPTPVQYLLINNVQIFNGKDEKTITGNVLIENNTISKISTAPIPTNKSANVRIIDGKGKFLMPGLIDAHYHAMFATLPQAALLTADIGYVNVAASKNAGEILMRGFTSVRDLGGPVFGLKRAIDEGLCSGPRIWPSGAFISQTGGHGDFRMPNEIPRDPNGTPSYAERINAAMIADNPDDVRRCAREQLMMGASQLKLMAGGGVSSFYDPIDVSQYTEAEFRAAVEAAENWGTYVTVHAYTPKAIRTAIMAGVKCIDHGQLADEATAKLMAEKDIWWSIQPFLDDEFSIPQSNPVNRAKQLEVANGTDTAVKLAKKYKIKTAWGTDVLFDAKLATNQGAQLAKMTLWYTPFEVLKLATYDNAQLLALSGNRAPYAGKLGVVEEGALADLLLVNGNPLQNIDLVADPANFVLIVKDGKVVKDAVK